MFPLILASASGNLFGFLWQSQAPEGFEGPAWARELGVRGEGLGLDGLFLLQDYQPGEAWVLDHWDPDGGRTFCSNGTRAAVGLLPPGGPEDLEVLSAGARVTARRRPGSVGLRLPSGPGYGFQSVRLGLEVPHVFAWTGTPHLVVEVPAVDAVDLATYAPPLRHHPALPQGANVTVLEVLGPGEAKVRTFERGVEGETLCCGQGAAVAGAWLSRRTGIGRTKIQPRGRDAVEVDVVFDSHGNWQELWLSGPICKLGSFYPDPERSPS